MAEVMFIIWSVLAVVLLPRLGRERRGAVRPVPVEIRERRAKRRNR